MTSTPFLRAAYATPREALVATAATPLAIFGYLHRFVMIYDVPALYHTQEGRKLIGAVGRHQDGVGFAYDLLGRIPVESLGCLVPTDDGAVYGLAYDRVV